MGKQRRKRRSSDPPDDTDAPSVKTSRNSEVSLFVDDLHAEESAILADLLVDPNLVFIKGPVGCGKTTLVKRVGEYLDLPVKVIHLNDQIDSKSFLGSYQCTDVPGEFVWEYSDFAEAVTQQCLILLEDLDCASPDLVSSLLLMAKSRQAVLQWDEGFAKFHGKMRLVATIRSENNHSESAELIGSNPLVIELPEFTHAELKQIIDFRFPKLKSVSARLLEIYIAVGAKLKEDSLIDRELNSADLIRACSRIAKLYQLDDNNRIFSELADVFVLSIASLTKRAQAALILGEKLAIPPERVDTLLRKQSPEISPTTNHVLFGRAKLSVRKGLVTDMLSNRSFGLTMDARMLIERIAVCVSQKTEAILLTGETGVGKTSVVQYMANYLNTPLDVVNMSQDSDSSDLIGGYKPIGTMELLTPFVDLMDQHMKDAIDVNKNSKFLAHFKAILDSGQFAAYLELCFQTAKKFLDNNPKDPLIWADMIVRAKRLRKALNSRMSALPFTYVEGIVTKAAKNGHWLLIDEINLASSECLDAIIQVLDGLMGCHPCFRLFACMNPATDTGKRKLPVGIRSRFTEFFVHEPSDRDQLTVIVRNYLPSLQARSLGILLNFYDDIVVAFPRKYSLRNLCRALCFASQETYGSEIKSIYEGVSMAFGSDLDTENTVRFEKILHKHFNNVPSGAPRKMSNDRYLLIEGSYIEIGDNRPSTDEKYIYTPSIKKNLSRLSRAVASGKFPVLLEGETSAGKTSMIMHLALITGNIVHRINNHEHTDVQEYIGCYAPSEDGKLTFVDGVLLKAVREGHWVILDELNLAPVEVLEALNRLLDDNRELFVAEKNLTVKAHPRFRLFATQNPVGTYAGRKRLSRAFLNRFIVLRFDHPPFSELTEIVCARCGVANSPASTMIKVLTELKRCRSNAGLFSSSDGLMTLRDLFRWANRLAMSESGDWRQVLADQGYFLLAARCRNTRDADEVCRVLEKVLKVKIDPEALFGNDSPYLPEYAKNEIDRPDSHIVPTFAMRRMLILTAEAWRCSEPILMVGETGCGKTTAAEIISCGLLKSINCHERTETADLLGSIRPNSDGTFFWQDGVVVQAMKTGHKLLIDEISLAADSVLERLNSLLEPTRTVLLTDAGADAKPVTAHHDFQVIATMNPGTDHGKKELSKALRNRFTEIWCSCDHPVDDIKRIVCARMSSKSKDFEASWASAINVIVDFFVLFNQQYSSLFRTVFSIRDIIAAADLFIACLTSVEMSVYDAVVNSLTGVVLDSIGVIPARTTYNAKQVKKECNKMIQKLLREESVEQTFHQSVEPKSNAIYYGDFPIQRGSFELSWVRQYSFDAPTTIKNATRVARALLLEKPIMLEGSPGAGKSSLIIALAKATGHQLVRLNLSDQTDLSDLFGHDVPFNKADGSISFKWQDGPVLKAIKEGSWILLDEMNLASQSILEGLNSCFDFRQQLYIAELNKTFEIDASSCRFFACQNPQQQGGNRRALPKSFINRFTTIYIEPFHINDFRHILKNFVPDNSSMNKMIEFNKNVAELFNQVGRGSEFEFNTRDLLRWAQFVDQYNDYVYGAEVLYINRIDDDELREDARNILRKIFKTDLAMPATHVFLHADAGICFGDVKYNLPVTKVNNYSTRLLLLPAQQRLLQQLVVCIHMNWLVLLNGPRLSGKSSIVECVTQMAQLKLQRLRLNKETDASELLGTYEQVVSDGMLSDIHNKFIEILRCGLYGTDRELTDPIMKELEEYGYADITFLRRKLGQVIALCVQDHGVRKKLEDLGDQVDTVCLRFEWRNSAFVEAYKNGDWLLIEDVNCCSAAVLDRLNTCLEADGKLVLPEQTDGSIEEITPHPAFRVFFTMDPKNGPLSRAMKNRSVEFCVNRFNSWYGDTNSALNVLLKKEKVMCSSTNSNFQLAKNFTNENVKDALRVAARSNINPCKRLILLDPEGTRLTPGSDEFLLHKTDKVEVIVSNLPNVLPLMLSGKREARAPFIELPLVQRSNNGNIGPVLTFPQFQWQIFHRLAEYASAELNYGCLAEEYHLSMLTLSVMSLPPECLHNDSAVENMFPLVSNETKVKFLNIIRSAIRYCEISASITPWDLRFWTRSTDCVLNERTDRYVVQLLSLWLKNQVSIVERRLESSSPFVLSRRFADGEITLQELGSTAFNGLQKFVNLVVTALNTVDLISNGDDDLLTNVFHFIFDFAVMVEAVGMAGDNCHPLLALRRMLQSLSLAHWSSPDHPIWSLIRERLATGSGSIKAIEDFSKRVGTSSIQGTKKFVYALSQLVEAQPFQSKEQLEAVIPVVTSSRKAFVKSKHCKVVGPLTLNNIVDGLHDYMKAYNIFLDKDMFSAICREYPDAALQNIHLVDNLPMETESRLILQVLLALNSNFSIRKICPTLKTCNIPSVEILLDVICSFWKGFRFSLDSFSAIKLVDLSSASEKIAEYQHYLWNARKLGQSFNVLIEDSRERILPDALGNLSFVNLRNTFNNSLSLLWDLIPQRGMVDPALLQTVNIWICRCREKVLQLFASCEFIFPAVNSSHPLLRYINDDVQNTMLSLDELTSSAKEVYRVHHLRFDEFSEQMRSFAERLRAITGNYVVVSKPWAFEEPNSVVFDHATRTNNLVNLLEAFCDKLLFEFSDIPDVVIPVYSLLQILLMVLYNQAFFDDRSLRLRRLTGSMRVLKLDTFKDLRPSLNIYPENSEALNFALTGREGHVPMQFQCAVVRSIFVTEDLGNVNMVKAFKWFVDQWKIWFEQHKEKREQMFVMKQRASTRMDQDDDDDEGMEDPEDLEIRQVLPEFGDDDFEEVADDILDIPSRLPDAKDFAEFMDLFMNPKNGAAYPREQLLLPTVFFIDLFSHTDAIANPHLPNTAEENVCIEHSTLMDYHAIYVDQFRRSLKSSGKSSKVINVYTENDKSEVVRCVNAMVRLQKRVHEVLEKFPENATLRDIDGIISTFLNADCGVPQLRLASWVEKVLEQADNWQKLACREYSLSECLDELMDILVDWRKLQVSSWHHIIKAIDEQSRAIAMAMSFSLIEALEDIPEELDTTVFSTNFLTMLVSWLQSSTLIDFHARLDTTKFIERYCKSEFSEEHLLSDLTEKISSVHYYFEAYSQTVTKKLEEKRAAAVQDLENFVTIVKFHDLNLWSVKASAEKAHQKLFKIIKKYKLEGNEELATLFTDFLPGADVPSTIKVLVKPTYAKSSSIYLNFENLHTNFSDLLLSMPGINEPTELADVCVDYLGILDKDVVYNGENDEANEKLQGQALFDRQRRFAALIKDMANFGLRGRRGGQVATDEIVQASLTTDARDSGLDAVSFRSCAIIRNSIIRVLNQLNTQKDAQILKQVSTQMLGHIRGLTEYGFAWQAKAVETFKRLRFNENWLRSIVARLNVYAKNAARDPPVLSASTDIQQFYCSLKSYIKGAIEVAVLLKRVIDAAPEKLSTADPACYSTAIHKEHPDYASVLQSSTRLVSLLETAMQACDTAESNVVEELWPLATLEELQNSLRDVATEGLAILSDKVLFENFPANIKHLRILVKQVLKFSDSSVVSYDVDLQPLDALSSDCFYRKMQQLYKAVSSKIDDQSDPIDVLKRVAIACSVGVEIAEEAGTIDFVMGQLEHNHTASHEDLEKYLHCVTELADLYTLVVHVLSQFIDSVSAFYVNLGHVFVRILKKGFVNPIPKKDETAGGTGNDIEDAGGENCGMGDGEGAKDVGKEIEETGQVEDLKNDDESKDQDETSGEKPKDAQTPLDMEDDFAADLENLDADEAGEDNNEKEEEEENHDWDMDNVEEPEEQQLDPNLWEKPEPKDNALDDGAEGADNQTDEVAAKENDDTVAKEDDKDKQAEDAEENAKEDVEKEQEEEEQFDLENANQIDAGDDEEDETEREQHENEMNEEPSEEDPEDAEDATLDDQTEMEQEQEENDGDENSADAAENTTENEVEENAQADEFDKATQGQSAQTDQQQQNSAGGDREEDESQDQRDEATESKETSAVGQNENKNMSNSAAEKRDAQEQEDVGENENDDAAQADDMHIHAQPAEEEAMQMDKVGDDDVEEAMEGDELDEASKKRAHIADEQRTSFDQHVIQKSSIEEARTTRSQYERVKLDYEGDAEVPEGKQDEERPMQEDVVEEWKPSEEELASTKIHITADFFDLSKEAVGRLSDIDVNVNESPAAISDPKKFAYLSDSVSLMASELAENLRQILEPSIANRLQGDYRTGKRLNMRRLVSYIASDYRKNRIWLRRTKKQQRNFQIMIAIDDSKSMGDNRMGEITCQSLCLIEKAFRQLEVGQLAICKFGEQVQCLRDFASATDAQDTLVPSLLENLRFDQNRTHLTGLLANASSLFERAKENTPGSSLPVQMLVIIGDGQGVFAEGRDTVMSAIREMENQRITVLYVIVDGKNSVVNVNYSNFEDGKLKLVPYMSMFPFPFYALVRSITTLPGTLAEAIRQWFEMTMRD